MASENVNAVIEMFNQIYYHAGKETWYNTFWLGYPTLKYPSDLWIYQEIISETKPEVIIETGTYHGGSALYMAMICDALNSGDVITVDVDEKNNRPKHPRITYLSGSSTSPEILEKIKSLVGERKKIMVILDSDHSKQHVLNELKLYHEFVLSGNYLIVEDTTVNGHPVHPNFGPGPMEALDEFLKENNGFQIDRSREKLLVTQNPRGFLKKV